jgi:SSS family solute:Na+ symporter
VRRGKEGFFLAGRKLSAPLIAVTVTGLAIGGASTIGVAQNAFQGQGLAAGWYGVAWSVSALVVGLVVSRRFRRLEVVTVPQMFEEYYDEKARVACVVVQVLVQIVITSLQYVAGGTILNQLLPEVFPTIRHGMVFSAVVFIGLTMVGGLWSAGLSNLLNVSLIYVGIALAAALSVRLTGGIAALTEQLPAGGTYLHPVTGMGWNRISMFVLVMVTCNIGFQATVQIAFAARNEKTARNGFLLGAILVLPCSFLAALVGVAAKAYFPEIEDAATALPRMVGSLNPLVAGITLAALWAADVSTACGLLLSSATVVVRDIYARYSRSKTDQRQQLRINRLVVLAVGVVTLALAWQITEILKALMQGLSLTTGLTVVILFTFYAPRLCRVSSAFWTVVTGVVVMAAWQLASLFWVLPHVIYVEWMCCVAVFLLVAKLDSRPVAQTATVSS